jgi:hypothetical protein
LLLEEDVRDQLSLTFRLRGAWLLGHSLARRSELYRVFRALYDLRSEAVHRGEVKWERRLSGAPINVRELLDRGFDLCREALRRIIHAGAVPDWETLLLGDRKP